MRLLLSCPLPRLWFRFGFLSQSNIIKYIASFKKCQSFNVIMSRLGTGWCFRFFLFRQVSQKPQESIGFEIKTSAKGKYTPPSRRIAALILCNRKLNSTSTSYYSRPVPSRVAFCILFATENKQIKSKNIMRLRFTFPKQEVVLLRGLWRGANKKPSNLSN